MRLFEIFDGPATPANIDKLEKTLDDKVYQPANKVQRREPVLDLEINSSPSSHFIQRYSERAKKADFGLMDIMRLLAGAKTGAIPGYKDELDDLSRENYPLDDIVIKGTGPNPLTIPAIVKPNPAAKNMQDGNPVASTRNGEKVPKNVIIPKTVYRKGIDD